MPQAVIEDFRGGVDRRKNRASGAPGTLWVGSNCHVTKGGEIEKRLKLVPKYVLPTGKTWGMKGGTRRAYVFGYEDPASFSPPIPGDVAYQRLIHPGVSTTAIDKILDVISFAGKQYAIVKFVDGSIHHYYDAARVTAWDDGVMTSWRNTNAAMATHLAALVNEDKDFSAAAVGSVVTITARQHSLSGTITATAENGGATNDQTAVAVVTQTADPTKIEEVRALGYLSIDVGSGAGDNVTSITVGSTEILGATVSWNSDGPTTARNLSTAINAFGSGFTTTVDGTSLVIKAPAGSGATVNGDALAFAGTLTIGFYGGGVMSGGVTASTTTHTQVATVTIGGTAEVDDRFTITVAGRTYGAGGNPLTKATFGIAVGTKLYLASSSIVYFNAVNDPTIWRANENGAGFFNVTSSGKGSEDLVAMAPFQFGIAFFASTFAQTWNISADPVQNAVQTTIDNAGAVAVGGVVNYGNIDTFVLSTSGIRSLKQQAINGAPFAADAGDNIDDLVRKDLVTLSSETLDAAQAAVNPVDGRAWFWIGERIYVLSTFPSSKIQAWTWYDITGWAPGNMDAIGNRMYLRSGDTIYIYGGETGDKYDADEDDIYYVDIELPFMHAGRIADDKIAVAYDVGAEGEWNIFMKLDPNRPDVEDGLGTVDFFTYPDPTYAAAIETTHFAPRFRSTQPGPAKICNFVLGFEKSKR